MDSYTCYGAALLHGEAVAAGQALAFRFSASQGLCAGQDATRASAAIAAAGLPTRLEDIPGHPFDAGRLVRHMAQDKKAEAGRLTFILARALGEAFVAKDVDAKAVERFLISEGAHAGEGAPG
jgi:3-dehydroquinate synthase